MTDEAADGYEAIALAAATEPDFVILDQMMPLLDGTDALTDIVAASPRSQVIVNTSIDSPALAALAFERGAAAFLDKKRNLHDLVTVLAELRR